MSLPKYTSPFPKINLSKDEKADIQAIATRLVTYTVTEYEDYLWRQHGQLDTSQWSHVREKDKVRVFQDRRQSASTTNTLLAVGTFIGELDDAMYGVLSQTTDSVRLQAAYTRDRVTNCAVLVSLSKPTTTDSFHCTCIKWLVLAQPLHIRALSSKKRDKVIVDHTGTTTLSNGESIGFQVLHSISLPQTPPLSGYTRGEMSMCFIFRQISEDRVQVFAKTVVANGSISSGVRAAADRLVAAAKVIPCAQMKKLSWLMRCKGSDLHRPPKRSVTGALDLTDRPSSERTCDVCPPRNRHSAKSACTVCHRLVCSSCRVKLELRTITPDRRLLEQRVSFCSPCHSIAVRATAIDVASDEAMRCARREAAELPISDLVYLKGGCSDDRNGGGRMSFPSSSVRTMEEDVDAGSSVGRARSASERTIYILGDD